MNNLRLEHFLPEHMESFRDDTLNSRISDKTSANNFITKLLSKLEHKTTNGIIYHSVCLLFLCFALLVQTRTFVQNNPSAMGMLFLTIFFIIFVMLSWKKPILKIRGLASVLSPFLVKKLVKNYSKEERAQYKGRLIEVIIFRIISIIVLVTSVLIFFEFGKKYSNFSYVGNFNQNFVNDIFAFNRSLSSNIFLYYFLLIAGFCIILSVFSNPFYVYERVLIRKKIEGDTWFNIIFTILSGFIILFLLNFQYPQYLTFLLRTLNEIFLAAIVGVGYLVTFTLVYFLFNMLRKLSSNNVR